MHVVCSPVNPQSDAPVRGPPLKKLVIKEESDVALRIIVSFGIGVSFWMVVAFEVLAYVIVVVFGILTFGIVVVFWIVVSFMVVGNFWAVVSGCIALTYVRR